MNLLSLFLLVPLAALLALFVGRRQGYAVVRADNYGRGVFDGLIQMSV